MEIHLNANTFNEYVLMETNKLRLHVYHKETLLLIIVRMRIDVNGNVKNFILKVSTYTKIIMCLSIFFVSFSFQEHTHTHGTFTVRKRQ